MQCHSLHRFFTLVFFFPNSYVLIRTNVAKIWCISRGWPMREKTTSISQNYHKIMKSYSLLIFCKLLGQPLPWLMHEKLASNTGDIVWIFFFFTRSLSQAETNMVIIWFIKCCICLVHWHREASTRCLSKWYFSQVRCYHINETPRTCSMVIRASPIAP